MSNQQNQTLGSIFITVILTLIASMLVLVGFVNGTKYKQNEFEKEAIKRGYALYDQETGNWKWKE